MSETATMQGFKPRFADRLTIDLATDPLLHHPPPGVEQQVRGELMAIRDLLTGAFPQAGIMVTGSLFAAEGQGRLVRGRLMMLSDYDLCLISPRLADTLPWSAVRRIRPALEQLHLSATLEIGFVWERLLRQRRTTIGGGVIGGSRDLAPLLKALPAPRPFSALLQAYRALSLAPTQSETHARHAGKGLLRAAYTFLLHRMGGPSRDSWIALCSLQYVAEALHQYASTLGDELLQGVDDACDYLLNDNRKRWCHVEDQAQITEWAARLAMPIPETRSLAGIVKHACWLVEKRRPGLPCAQAGSWALRGLRALAEGWKDGRPSLQAIATAQDAARRLSPCRLPRPADDPLVAYVHTQALLSAMAGYNPHKRHFGPTELSS